jgi:hypothetical protein
MNNKKEQRNEEKQPDRVRRYGATLYFTLLTLLACTRLPCSIAIAIPHNFPPPRKLVVVHRQDVVRQCDRLQRPCQHACTARSSDVVFSRFCCDVLDNVSVHCCVPACFVAMFWTTSMYIVVFGGRLLCSRRFIAMFWTT